MADLCYQLLAQPGEGKLSPYNLGAHEQGERYENQRTT